MKVVLRSDVGELGRRGEVVDVAAGHARNYLVPRGLALVATPGVLKQAESMRRARVVKDARDKGEAEELAVRLARVVTIAARAGTEGRLFGSVTPADVAAAIAEQTGVTVDRRRLQLDEPIKSLGAHEVPIRLHREVTVVVPVEVVAS